jgi:uncharacterized protein with PIN domain
MKNSPQHPIWKEYDVAEQFRHRVRRVARPFVGTPDKIESAFGIHVREQEVESRIVQQRGHRAIFQVESLDRKRAQADGEALTIVPLIIKPIDLLLVALGLA